MDELWMSIWISLDVIWTFIGLHLPSLARRLIIYIIFLDGMVNNLLGIRYCLCVCTTPPHVRKSPVSGVLSCQVSLIRLINFVNFASAPGRMHVVRPLDPWLDLSTVYIAGCGPK